MLISGGARAELCVSFMRNGVTLMGLHLDQDLLIQSQIVRNWKTRVWPNRKGMINPVMMCVFCFQDAQMAHEYMGQAILGKCF